METTTDTPADAGGAVMPSQRAEAFTFGDPVPVLDGRELLDYIECWRNGKWYEPPMSWDGLARAFRSSTHHESALRFKAAILTSTFEPHRLLSRDTFQRFALDFLIFGNAYLERTPNMLGRDLGLKHTLAKCTRRGADLESYYFVRGWSQEHEFKSGSVFHLMEADINQEVYGLPQYLATMQSALLNESATLFRRRYYNNGSHAGFIMYITDAAHQHQDIDDIRDALRNSKGPGNFRNLFLYAPNGKPDGLKIIPVGEITAKDDFINIKNVSRDDVLAAHRIPPQLMGIVPSNTGGFGAILPAAQVFARNEVEPLQAAFRSLNDWMGDELMRFRPYVVPALAGEGGPAPAR
ncbi:phage portal protein [Paracidovorax citrulli]|uniref:phage portal protein n=1 Tax=Paracidovorax citrulli TaxID=80869 RepID=UPI0005FABD67|nr:phage portal protein [Paracidovorax citrulli]